MILNLQMLKKLALCCLSLIILISATTDNTKITGTKIYFVEKEPKVEHIRIRMLLTPRFLRVDTGFDNGDFILFDRKQRLIQNVVHADKTILNVSYTGFKVAPLVPDIKISKQERLLPDAPRINQFALKQIVTRVNDLDCKKTIVAVKLLPRVTKAMQELNTVLADQYARGMKNMVFNNNRAKCDLVTSVYEVNSDLRAGFPVQTNRNNGWSRSLVDFKENVTLSPKLFSLPQDYFRYSLPN